MSISNILASVCALSAPPHPPVTFPPSLPPSVFSWPLPSLAPLSASAPPLTYLCLEEVSTLLVCGRGLSKLATSPFMLPTLNPKP